MTTRPEIPTQDGWAVEMHGECVLFCSNAEKAAGSSPGARVRVFSEATLREYADACVTAEIARLQAQVAELQSAMLRAYSEGRLDEASSAAGLRALNGALQAQVDALAVALERAKRTMADYGQCDNDNWPCFQAVCAALAAVGR